MPNNERVLPEGAQGINYSVNFPMVDQKNQTNAEIEGATHLFIIDVAVTL